jgi:hypothetical protein
MITFINVSNAAINDGHRNHSKKFRLLSTVLLLPYYFLNSKKAKLEVKRFKIDPSFEVAQTMWNLLETDGIKHIFKATIPSIAYKKKFYLKREQVEITREYLSVLLENEKASKNKINLSDVILPKHKICEEAPKDQTYSERKENLFVDSRSFDKKYIKGEKIFQFNKK